MSEDAPAPIQRLEGLFPVESSRDFLHLEAASGFLLSAASAVALLFANTGLAHLHDAFLDLPVVLRIGEAGIDQPLRSTPDMVADRPGILTASTASALLGAAIPWLASAGRGETRS